MRVNHGRSIRRFVRRGVACAALAAGGAAPLTSWAYPLEASITGFVKNNPSVTGVAGNYIRTSDVRYINSIAVTEAKVLTAGRSISVATSVRAASTAGRVIAGACFVNPVLCVARVGTVALIDWFLSSQIEWDEAAGQWTKRGPPKSGRVYCNQELGVVGQGGAEICAASKPAEADLIAASFCKTNSVLACRWEINSPQWLWDLPTDGASISIFYKRPNQPGEFGAGAEITTRIGELPGDPRPATSTDFDEHADNKPIHVGLNPDNQIGWSSDAVLDSSPVPVPVEAPVFTPTTEDLSAPYPGTDPQTGPWKQDVIKITGKPETPEPLDVEGTPGTKDVDNPNTEEDEGPAEGDEDPVTVPKEDPCQLHPNSVMCTDVGTAPGDEVPKRDVSVDFAAESVGLPSGCPAPVSMGRFGQLSFEGACDAVTTAKPLVIAFAALAAAMLMLAAIRRQ